MSENGKGQIKSLARMAKDRLKNGFWEDYKDNVTKKVNIAKEEGENTSGVIKYYKEKATRSINEPNESEESFYIKVKNILDNYGEVSDMIGRLCDDEYFNGLTFVEKERYLFTLAERYRACKERYDEEKRYSFASEKDEDERAV